MDHLEVPNNMDHLEAEQLLEHVELPCHVVHAHNVHMDHFQE